MELREEHALVRLVQRETEAALSRDIAQLLIVCLVPVELVHVFVHVDLRVAAFPCTEVLQPRPEIPRVQVSLIRQNLAQLCRPFGFRGDVRIQRRPDIKRDLEIFAYRSLLDIRQHLFRVLIQRAEQLEDRGRVRRGPQRHVAMLQREPHQHVVTCTVVRDRHDRCRRRIVLLDDRRDIAYQHAAHRTKQGSVRRIAFAFLAYRREDMSAEDTTAVLDEVPCPYMTHLAIYVLQVLMRHRDPFRRTRRTGRRRVHVRFTGEQDVLLAVLMPLHVRTQRLERVVHRHVQPVQTEQVLRCRGTQDAVKMVFFSINGVAGDSEYVSERLLRHMTRLTAPESQTDRLQTTNDAQHRVDNPRIRQCSAFVIQIGFVLFAHLYVT